MIEHAPRDLLARPLRDLRISVTDRCNFRCTYCMPSEVFGPGFEFLPHREVLTFEEIARLARVFVGLGVEKVRVTGGEPLLRRDLPRLIEQLAAIPGLADLTLTTNGALLPRLAAPLAAAGLRRVTVSLDALDDAVFRRITDTASISVTQVLAGIEAASRAGLAPVKVNAVIVRGVNEDQIVPLAERFRGSGHILRFIEFMDVGASNGWRMDQVVPAREIRERLGAAYPIEALAPNYGGEVAERWRYRDGGGEVGVIASVTRPFCGGCTRARLSADGQFFTCLFATHGHSLKRPLRDGCSDEQLGAAIAAFWSGRDDRYSELRARSTPGYATMRKIEMSYIGG